MPHIIVEYSGNLEAAVDVRTLVKTVHRAALATGIFEVAAVRTRAERRDVYEIADGNPDNIFVAITARIAPGRDEATRTRLGKALLDAANEVLASLYARKPLAISVEVQEIVQVGAFRQNNLHERLKATAAAAAAR
jgi:5-carboxymethyl-2-hydroxymuconate isomerase